MGIVIKSNKASCHKALIDMAYNEYFLSQVHTNSEEPLVIVCEILSLYGIKAEIKEQDVK